MGVSDHDIITTGLLSVLLFVLVMAVLMVMVIIRWRHLKAVPMPAAASDMPPVGDGPVWPEPPQFTPKRAHAWLAIRSANAQAVQAALALHDPKPCSWAEGLQADGEQRVFVSPPVAGWVLVIGPAVPEPADDVDACFRVLTALSRKLGQVQYYNVNTLVDHHAWVRTDAGRIVRAYAWAGKTLWNQGRPTPAENMLDMRCLDYGEAAEPVLFSAPEPGAANSEKVHLLAARWSLDPAEIDARFIQQRRGIVGEASRLF